MATGTRTALPSRGDVSEAGLLTSRSENCDLVEDACRDQYDGNNSICCVSEKQQCLVEAGLQLETVHTG